MVDSIIRKRVYLGRITKRTDISGIKFELKSSYRSSIRLIAIQVNILFEAPCHDVKLISYITAHSSMAHFLHGIAIIWVIQRDSSNLTGEIIRRRASSDKGLTGTILRYDFLIWLLLEYSVIPTPDGHSSLQKWDNMAGRPCLIIELGAKTRIGPVHFTRATVTSISGSCLKFATADNLKGTARVD